LSESGYPGFKDLQDDDKINMMDYIIQIILFDYSTNKPSNLPSVYQFSHSTKIINN